ncbi:hypothetical protein ElyMa_003258600 [Elysia marginata]|uniref:Uncharacterized protein n=1 Tax=Elysia marginata TaxID=1093978 RepID=A0AAV4J5Z9_9GAST|nr:hypothetical protein ElyMa_003258600 [Elysia marginata]
MLDTSWRQLGTFATTTNPRGENRREEGTGKAKKKLDGRCKGIVKVDKLWRYETEGREQRRMERHGCQPTDRRRHLIIKERTLNIWNFQGIQNKHNDWLCGLAVKTLAAQRSGGTGSIPGRVKPRTLKLVLVADPPGVWRYGFSAKSGRPGVRIM